MSTRSTATAVTSLSAQPSGAGSATGDTRSLSGAAGAGQTASGTTGSTASSARPGDRGSSSSGGGDFQRLLTHVGTSTQGNGTRATATNGKTAATPAKGRERKADSTKVHRQAPASGAPVGGPIPLVPVPATPVPAGKSTSGTGDNERSVPRTANATTGSHAAALPTNDATGADSSAAKSTNPASPGAQSTVQARANGKRTATSAKPIDLASILGEAPTHGAVRQSATATNAAEKTKEPMVSKGGTSDTTAALEAAAARTVASANPTGTAASASSTGPSSASSAGAVDTHHTHTHSAHSGRGMPTQLPVTANPVPATKLMLNAPVGTSHWHDELANQLTWMAHHNLDAATLHVTPAGLGPIEARIAMHGSHATVWFGASHADTRAALEQALPRLRAMFAMQGLSLTDSGVFREAPRRRPPSGPSVSAVSRVGPVAQPSTAAQSSTSLPGLVDLYA